MKHTPKIPRETVRYTIFMDKRIRYYDNIGFPK